MERPLFFKRSFVISCVIFGALTALAFVVQPAANHAQKRRVDLEFRFVGKFAIAIGRTRAIGFFGLTPTTGRDDFHDLARDDRFDQFFSRNRNGIERLPAIKGKSRVSFS